MKRTDVFAGIVSAAILASIIPPAFAQVPKLIRYQGQVVDSQGVPLEGPYSLHFRLYNAQTGGTVVWEETQANIPITKGQFSILLGQVTPLTAMQWDQPCWLSVQVNAESELAPRQQITSVPLAIRSEMAEKLTQPIVPSLITPQGSGSGLDGDTVDGKHASDLLNRANHSGTQPSSTITGTFAPSVISPQGSGSGLDADTVDGAHAADLRARASHTGTQAPTTISPQGAGSGLDADYLDGKDSSQFASNPHTHQCTKRMNLPTGQSASGFCPLYGEWCALTVTGNGQSLDGCGVTNPGFGDWGAICCR